MKRIALTGVVMALILVAGSVAPVMAADVAAGFSITENISLTVSETDVKADGVQFGPLTAGASDQPDDGQDMTTGTYGAITLDIVANVDVDISLSGLDFSGGGTFTVDHVKYDDDYTLNEGSETGEAEGVMSTTPAVWQTVTAYTDPSIQVYHWVSVPAGQPAAAYLSTFTYSASAS